MSSERTLVDSVVPLPAWASLELTGLAASTLDREALPTVCARALERLLGAGATAEVTFEGPRVGPLGEMEVDRAALSVRGWALPKLPHPRHVSALADNATHRSLGNYRSLLIRRLAVLFDDIRLAGLRCRRIEMTGELVRGQLGPGEDGALLTLREAASFETSVEIHPDDVRDYLIAQAPWIIGGSVHFVNGARLVADGKVRLGFFPVSGRLSGALTVANGTDLLLEDVSVTVAGRHVPPGIVAGKLREVNPVITLQPLVEAGLHMELLAPETNGSVLRLLGRARTP